MIITCNNCNKNFEVDPSLIPEKGRLLQCNSCDHKWFFKKENLNDPISSLKLKIPSEEQAPLNEDIKVSNNEDIKVSKTKNSEIIKLLDEETEDNLVIEKIPINVDVKKKKIRNENLEPKVEKAKNKKSYNILSLTIVFIISFISLIIILDTFQNPIGKIIPNIEHLLYNLYETVNDVMLFFNDLI